MNPVCTALYELYLLCQVLFWLYLYSDFYKQFFLNGHGIDAVSHALSGIVADPMIFLFLTPKGSSMPSIVFVVQEFEMESCED